jgi:hypothetical protein
LALPRRDAGEAAASLVDTLTRLWGRGTQTMRPIQALAIADIADYGGAFLPIVASGGKRLISYLAPVFAQAKRPLLLVPGKLLEETRRAFWGPGGCYDHWQGPPPDTYRIESYQWLSNPSQGAVLSADGKHVLREDALELYAPDLIFGDEGHSLKADDSVARKRVEYYRERCLEKGRRCSFVFASGTFAKEGVTNYAHLLEWCLGVNAPLPLDAEQRANWCNALDDKVTEPLAPGALLQLCNEKERAAAAFGLDAAISAARQGYRRRFHSCPGVVASQNVKPLHMDGDTLRLTFEPLDPGKGDPTVEKWVGKLKKYALTPTDEPVPDKKEEWRHERALVCADLHYRWDPPPPRDWLDTRKAACAWVRETLRYCDRYAPMIDSEAKVWAALQAGRFDDGGVYSAWREIAPTFTPNPVPVWHSDEATNAAATYLANNPTGVVWSEHSFFGARLARVAGVPYFGALGRDAAGKFVLDHKGPCVVSRKANYEGRDMQWNWDRALIMCFPQCPVISEQMLARIHRDGQRTKTVRFHVWIGSYNVVAGVAQAQRGAKANEEREGGAQRVLYAESSLPSLAELKQRGGSRWKP